MLYSFIFTSPPKKTLKQRQQFTLSYLHLTLALSSTGTFEVFAKIFRSSSVVEKLWPSKSRKIFTGCLGLAVKRCERKGTERSRYLPVEWYSNFSYMPTSNYSMYMCIYIYCNIIIVIVIFAKAAAIPQPHMSHINRNIKKGENHWNLQFLMQVLLIVH